MAWLSNQHQPSSINHSLFNESTNNASIAAYDTKSMRFVSFKASCLLAFHHSYSKGALSFVHSFPVSHHITTSKYYLMITSKETTTSRFFQKRLMKQGGSSCKKSRRDQTKSKTEMKLENNAATSSSSSSSTNRTHSFPPQVHSDKSIKIHTLILGTHPSITSLAKVEYFGHPQNAFWWIAGDCLGFRRSVGTSPSTGKPYKLTNYLWHGEEKVIPYHEQMETLTSKGFALWDLFQSCERKGSLDNDIKHGQPNDIREFCLEHETIGRIILANGSKQCDFFNKHFEQWWLDGELRPGKNELSQKAFGKWSKKTNGFQSSSSRGNRSSSSSSSRNSSSMEGRRQIEVYCMPGVSPAAASVSYVDKRSEFQKYCYEPGMMDYKRLSNVVTSGNETTGDK